MKLKPAARTRAGTANPQQTVAVPTDIQMAPLARRPAPVDVAGVTASRQTAAKQKCTTVFADWTATELAEAAEDHTGPAGEQGHGELALAQRQYAADGHYQTGYRHYAEGDVDEMTAAGGEREHGQGRHGQAGSHPGAS